MILSRFPLARQRRSGDILGMKAAFVNPSRDMMAPTVNIRLTDFQVSSNPTFHGGLTEVGLVGKEVVV